MEFGDLPQWGDIFANDFEEDDEKKDKIGPIPGNKHIKPYFYLRTIIKTIQKGGFISTRIYVPKCIWLQEGEIIEGIYKKIEYYELLLTEIKKLRIYYTKKVLTKTKVVCSIYIYIYIFNQHRKLIRLLVLLIICKMSWLTILEIFALYSRKKKIPLGLN